MSARHIQPLHTWTVGEPPVQAYVHLLRPDAHVVEAHERERRALAAYARPVPLLFMSELYVPPRLRRGGLAGVLLNAVTAYADQLKVDLWLYCAPFGKGARLTAAGLAKLYAAHGFKRVALDSPDIEMVRRCREG